MATRKEIIIDTSIKMFNTKGINNVTTINIAEELNISVGNLYYYFKNKEDIIITIYNDFMDLLSTQLNSFNTDIDMPFDFYNNLKFRMTIEDKYRFLRLEMNNLFLNYPKLKEPLENILLKKSDEIRNLYLHQMKFGYLIELDEFELEFLCSNSWILNSQWEIYWLLKKEENKNLRYLKGKLNFLLFVKRYLTEKMLEKSNFIETIDFIKKEIENAK